MLVTPNHKISHKSGLGGRFNSITKTGSEWAKTRMVSLWKLNHLEELDLALISLHGKVPYDVN